MLLEVTTIFFLYIMKLDLSHNEEILLLQQHRMCRGIMIWYKIQKLYVLYICDRVLLISNLCATFCINYHSCTAPTTETPARTCSDPGEICLGVV